MAGRVTGREDEAMKRISGMNAVTLITILTTALWCAPAAMCRTGENAAVVVSEVMFNPDGNENAREYVELLNRSDAPVSLEGWIIGDGAGFAPLIPSDGGGWTIPAGGYTLVMDPDYFTAGEPYDSIPLGTPFFTVTGNAIGSRGLSNSAAEPVTLIASTGDTVSVVVYDISCPAGHSWERIRPGGGDDSVNFAPSAEKNGTPGRANSVMPPLRYALLDSALIRIVPASPVMGGDVELFIACRNGGLGVLEGFTAAVEIPTGVEAGTVSFPGPVPPGEVTDETTVFVAGVPGGRLGALVHTIEGIDSSDSLFIGLDVQVPAGTLLLNEIMAAPADGGPEWVEIVNTGEWPVDLNGFSVRDSSGGRTAIIEQHIMIAPKGYAVIAGGPLTDFSGEATVIITPRFPVLNNDGDSVALVDFEGAVADSVSYDETEKGRSIERTGFTGGWGTSVDSSGATPGRANSVVFDPSATGLGVTLVAEPNPFGGRTTVTCTLPFAFARVKLLVYDRRGRLVARLRDGEDTGSSWTCEWDGSSGGTRLPAGPYILSLEAIDTRTGRIVTERTVIVAGTDL